jgi:hypothetical protein
LQELARYLVRRSDLNDVCVLYADIRVSGADQAVRAGRMMARYGFETTSASVDRRPLVQRMADALFVLLMAGVTNPCSLRSAPMRHANLRVFMSRSVLAQRHAARCADRVSSAEWPRLKSVNADPLSASPAPQPLSEIPSNSESPSHCLQQ